MKDEYRRMNAEYLAFMEFMPQFDNALEERFANAGNVFELVRREAEAEIGATINDTDGETQRLLHQYAYHNSESFTRTDFDNLVNEAIDEYAFYHYQKLPRASCQ